MSEPALSTLIDNANANLTNPGEFSAPSWAAIRNRAIRAD